MTTAMLALGLLGCASTPNPVASPPAPDPVVTVSPLAAAPGFPDWSGAGMTIPAAASTVNASAYGVVANDGQDDSAALQSAIDANKNSASVKAILLPAGTILLTKQIALDGNNLIVRGAGSDPATGTKIVFRPGLDTRYDLVTGGRPDFDGMTYGSGTANWIWPGRGAFRVQTRAVHSYYASDYAGAPANRKDLFEGSVNFHWRAGIKVRQSSPYAALQGATSIPLDAAPAGIGVGTYVQVGAANSVKMYQDFGATDSTQYENGMMRMQVFKVTAVSGNTITIDKPLEFDLPASNTSDGSAAIGGAAYYSKVTPIQMIQNVGFEDFYLTQEMTGVPALGGGSYNLTPAQAVHNYGNLAPEYAMHGIVFKWAADSWVKNVRTYMTGSHPIVTEVAKNLRVEGNSLDGAWNKGKGGNGYFRGSRVWDSLFVGNTSRNLRHFTFQWSASGNVARLNDFDSDINLHGGWERNNLLEYNTVAVPFEHAPGNCNANCGTDGGGTEAGQWYPIWWGAGAKATKWSGATGPRNVFLNNTLSKQTSAGGAYTPYYSEASRVYQFGWDRGTAAGSAYEHLKLGGALLADWSGAETANFSASPNAGLNANCTYSGSLYLANGTLTCTGGGGGGGGSGSAEVKAALNEDTASRTKYDVQLKNTGTTALSGLTVRVYVDLSEVIASGRSAADVRCDERYESAAATCTLVPYSGSVYYAKLDWGSYSLSAGSTLTYKITLRLADWSNNWSSANDYSRTGLTGAYAVTTRMPAYGGATLLVGTNP